MTRPVSIVLPALEPVSLLEENLPHVLEETERRALGDEVIVVDDTGRGALVDWLAERFPALRVHAREENGGFARALTSGIEIAAHPLVFSLNTDVRVRPGFLDPLVACLEDEEVFCVVPRVLLQGDEARIESVTTMQWQDGFARFAQPFASGEEERPPFRPIAVAFAVGGTCLFRRDDFLAGGGFDELFEPFYWEDIDLCWRAWRDGRRSLYQPASVVEHQHRGTIGGLVDEELVRAALAKNGYLFQWRHLDEASLRVHLASLYRLLIDAWQHDEREPLVHLNLALEQLPELLRARAALGEPKLGFREILERLEA